MNLNQNFKADRVAAQHCEELLARAAPKFDRAEATQSLFDRLGADLGERLRAHLIGPRPALSGQPGASQTGDAFMRSIGRKAANYVVSADDGRATLLLSFSMDHAARLTDRLFGGDGAASEQPTEALALSTTLALERIVGAIASSFRAAIALAESSFRIVHDADIARIAPYKRTAYCFSWEIEISQGEMGPWSLSLSLCEGELDALLQDQSTTLDKPSVTTGSRAVFSEIPVAVSAILAEQKMPLDRLSSLKPGDILPISPSRSVPLLIENSRIAEGRIGTVDDRIALQLTKTHFEGTS